MIEPREAAVGALRQPVESGSEDGHSPGLFPAPAAARFDPSAHATPFHDPACASNRTRPIHRWVPWIAGFSQEFVAGALRRHLDAAESRGTVLDPFGGVGTTLLEAVLAGHDAIGFEINPYAAFACRTKLKADRASPDSLRRAADRLLEFHRRAERRSAPPESKAPPGFRTRERFYSPRVLRKVLLTMDFVRKEEVRPVADFVRLAFASTMVGYSNYSYEPSLGTRSAAGRPPVLDHPVEETVARKLGEMALDAIWFREKQPTPRPKRRVVRSSFFAGYRRIAEGSVDLLVTSPPYLNNYHYNRNTRPQLWWLGLVSSLKEMKTLEEANFGRYWQTVREGDPVALDPSIRDPGIREALERIADRNRDRGIYGGQGWANYAATYFNDCARFVEGADWCLREGGTALVVIGNSVIQGVNVPTDRFLGSIAEDVGLELVDVHAPRSKRVGNSIINSDVRRGSAGPNGSLYEAVVELRKPTRGPLRPIPTR